MNAFPRNVECNLCGWAGRMFMSDSWHPQTVCPGCASQVRHRLLAAALASPAWTRIAENTAVLHFSPEVALRDVFRRHARTYTTADYSNRRFDVLLDMTDMRTVEDHSFDVVVALDVLEHVPDDRKAMRELRRVLKRSGHAILTVPQQDGLATTLEDPSVTEPSERERLYGQHDHVRLYGDDFAARLAHEGFDVTTVDEHSFDRGLVDRHVLAPPVLSTRHAATNHRRIYFARPTA